MEKPSLTIVDDGKLRGVIAPAQIVSRETLEDMIDFVELSTPEAAAETERRIKKANRKNSWIPFDSVYAKTRKAR